VSGRISIHPSLRLKLGAAFAGAMAVLLAGLGLFVYARFQASLDRSLDEGLRVRATDVRTLNAQADNGLAESRQILSDPRRAGFAQVLGPDGRVLDATPGVKGAALLSAAERRRAARRPLLIDRAGGREGPVRLLVTPASSQNGGSVLVVVGVSLHDRNLALHELSALMLLGGPVALLLASLLGYAVSALSLRSVAMLRRRAGAISVTNPGERLPVPPANDELRHLAVTLNSMLERNEAAFLRERRFVADASHELRTPLTVLKAELEVALTGPSSDAEMRAAIISADAEAGHVIGLAQSLLTLAQADHGALPLDLADVSVAEVLTCVAERFAEPAPKVLAGNAGEARVWADRARLEQALTSLVENAVRHGGGEVSLRAMRRGSIVELHVEDEGPGFPEGFVAVAFERFSRAESARSREGTGLGLAIVRSIARAHGGEARLANRSGGGADVWLALPVRASPRLRSAGPVSGEAGRRPLANPA
jgi:two-component system, OmpR family, sensor kinase